MSNLARKSSLDTVVSFLRASSALRTRTGCDQGQLGASSSCGGHVTSPAGTSTSLLAAFEHLIKLFVAIEIFMRVM